MNYYTETIIGRINKLCLTLVFGTSVLTGGAAVAAPTGRLAVVADGNYRDSDDICGTPVSLAIIKSFGYENQLVHYSHSCDLVPGSNDPGGDSREAEMQTSCDGTASRWGGFPNVSRFYNCQADQNQAAAIADLKDAINASSASDPLWIIEAGEPDIIYMALEDAELSKRQYVYVVTHHWANDKGDNYDLKWVNGSSNPRIDQMAGFDANKIKQITDQNTRLKKSLSEWSWANNHSDSRIDWLYDRGYLAQTAAMDYPDIVGYFDCSDAGMIYYWATGNQYCTVTMLKDLFLDYVNGSGENVAPTVSFVIPSSDLSGVPVGSTVSVQANASDSDGSISYVELFIDNTLVDRESIAPYEWGTGDPTLENMAAGTYELKLIATDNDGADSAPVYRTVEVGGATSGFEMDQLIAAADFSEESNPSDDNIIRDLGTKVGYTRDGAWIRYDNFDFGTGASSIEITLSSGNVGGTVEFRLDSATGTKIGEVIASGTGGWATAQDFNATLSSSATGTHSLYLVFKNTNGASGGLVDVWSFTVNSGGTPPVSTKVEAEDATITSGSVKDDPNASAGKYVDGESGFTLQWNVNATGGATDLSFRIKTPWTNTRSMGVFVNNSKVGTVTATAQAWTTETLRGVSMVNGSNTIELRDSEGTYELDVDFLELM